MEKLITAKFEVYWHDEKTIYFKFNKETDIELDDIKAAFDFQKEQGVSSSHNRIIHIEKHVDMSKDTREYLQENAPAVNAEAYIIPTLPLKIMFNLYTKLRKGKNPIKGFDKLETAVFWLKKQ